MIVLLGLLFLVNNSDRMKGVIYIYIRFHSHGYILIVII